MTKNPLATRVSFCPTCNTLLDTPDTDEIHCACCGRECSYNDFTPESLVVETSSAPRPEPRWISELKKNSDDDSQEQKRAIVEETCGKCGHNKANFYTLQLRSVDEGQTVFYECLKCGHKWSLNT